MYLYSTFCRVSVVHVCICVFCDSCMEFASPYFWSVGGGAAARSAHTWIHQCLLACDVHDKPVTSLHQDTRKSATCRRHRLPCILFPNSIKTMQTGFLWTRCGIFPNHLDMSRWFETLKLPCDIPISWSTSVTSP